MTKYHQLSQFALYSSFLFFAFAAPEHPANPNYYPRIVGGHRETSPDVVAWQAVILRNNVVHCGGSVISYNKVLTAAHCNIDKKWGKHTLIIGSSTVSAGKRYEIVQTYIHEGYRRGSRDEPIADVSVIEFHNGDRSIVPNYPTLNEDTTQPNTTSTVFISGFGQTAREGSSSDILRTVRVPVKDSYYCMREYGGISMSGSICAGSTAADSCQGDSGGGLWKRDPEDTAKFILMGIVSYGAGCAMVKSPGVYVRISMYKDWITVVMNKPPTPFLSSLHKNLIFWGTVIASSLLLATLLTIIVIQLRRHRENARNKLPQNFQV